MDPGPAPFPVRLARSFAVLCVLSAVPNAGCGFLTGCLGAAYLGEMVPSLTGLAFGAFAVGIFEAVGGLMVLSGAAEDSTVTRRGAWVAIVGGSWGLLLWGTVAWSRVNTVEGEGALRDAIVNFAALALQLAVVAVGSWILKMEPARQDAVAAARP